MVRSNFVNNKRAEDIIFSALFLCAKHGTNLASESLATGIYRQV